MYMFIYVGMSESTVRLAFNTFTENFVNVYYGDYISRPTGAKLDSMMAVFIKMGLPGCIGSTDCVHIKWDRCPADWRHYCKGKEGYPTLVYSVTVDHNRRILGISGSNFGSYNDKTLVRYDTYITDVHDGTVHSDVEYDLYIDGVLTKQKGVYYLCDGGYHKWSCMINPMKHTTQREERLWSEWVESTRKDVECCFGILKGRFRILKAGIQLQSKEKIDFVFFTCCILHNMILAFDGLDIRWEENVEWDTLNPQNGSSDDGYDISEVLNNWNSGTDNSILLQEQRIYNRIQSMEASVSTTQFVDNETEIDTDIGYDMMRKNLVQHFAKAYALGNVQWPRGFSMEQKDRLKCYNKR